MEHFPFTILFIGVAISTVAVMLGIGGGILWSPVLILLYKIGPGEAITTALALQIGGMGGGALSYWRSGRVDVKVALFYALLALPMVILGSVVGKHLPDTVLKLGLGVVAIGLALFFLSGQDWYRDNECRRIRIREALRVGYIPFFFSFLSGLLSIGVGDFIVPSLVKKLRYSMEVAVGTSLAVMFIVVVIGLAAHLLLGGTVSSPALAWGLPGVIIGSYLGSQLSRRIGGDTLREIFIFVMIFIGIHIVYRTI
jgi:uncharacterized membrane protein YfcA